MVSRWKVLLAASVIFSAGAATGALVVRTYLPRVVQRTHVTPPIQMSTEHRMEYVKKLDRELQLNPDQRQKIEAIIAASQGRMQKIWLGIEPQVHDECNRCSRRDISEVLNPEQREKMRLRWRRNGARSSNLTNDFVVSPVTNSVRH